jgi:hypothetical protein
MYRSIEAILISPDFWRSSALTIGSSRRGELRLR